MLKNVEVELVVAGVKEFTRRSGTVGQELLVDSDSKYPARIDAPDKNVLDLSTLKVGDTVIADVELTFTSCRMVSDSGLKYYKRIPTFKIKNII